MECHHSTPVTTSTCVCRLYKVNSSNSAYTYVSTPSANSDLCCFSTRTVEQRCPTLSERKCRHIVTAKLYSLTFSLIAACKVRHCIIHFGYLPSSCSCTLSSPGVFFWRFVVARFHPIYGEAGSHVCFCCPISDQRTGSGCLTKRMRQDEDESAR